MGGDFPGGPAAKALVSVGGQGSIPGQGPGSCVLQLENILPVTTGTRWSQINKENNEDEWAEVWELVNPRNS